MSESRSQLEGVFLAIAAFTCFVLADTCVKAIGKYHVPAFEVVSAVSVMEMVLLASFAAARGQLRALWPHRPLRPVLRSLLDLVNNLCVVIAVRHLPLALFYILVFLAPAVTTLLEAVFLKERLSGKRWLAVITGFIGVVIAVDPFGAARAGDRTGYLACMVCVACFSVNLVWSRRISQGETPQSLTFFSSMVQAAAGVALAMIPGVPLHPAAFVAVCCDGAGVAGGQPVFLRCAASHVCGDGLAIPLHATTYGRCGRVSPLARATYGLYDRGCCADCGVGVGGGGYCETAGGCAVADVSGSCWFGEQQIPFGNDRKKGKCNRNGSRTLSQLRCALPVEMTRWLAMGLTLCSRSEG